MALLEELVAVGYTKAEAGTLAENPSFHHSKKTSQELTALFNKIAIIYGCPIGHIKRAVLAHPPFAGLDHQRVVREATEVYGVDNEVKVKRAVLSHPQFAGYDHQRVVRQKARLGRIARLSENRTINLILSKPALAGYSVKRYLAAFDIGRQLESEGFLQDEKMLNALFRHYAKSPYVPGFNKKRISQVKREGLDYKEPPLLKAMRKALK